MLQTTFLNQYQPTLTDIRPKTGLMTWRQLLFAIAGGIALAGVGQFLGRTFHLAWPVPMSGSIVTALPRTLILLVILLRINRFGALTVAAIAEVSTKLAFGFGGWWPMSLVVPLLAGVAADTIWQYLRHLPSRRTSLTLTGGSLCAARVLLALSFWTILSRPIAGATSYLALTMTSIIVINIVLGMTAGFMVAQSVKQSRGNE